MDKQDFLYEIDDIFTVEQCNLLITKAESLGMTVVDSGLALYDRSILFDKELAAYLFDKIKPYLPQYFGTERIVGLNECFRFSKYKPGGKFKRHTDGINVDKDGNRAVMTLNIFLNIPEEGGGTFFYKYGQNPNPNSNGQNPNGQNTSGQTNKEYYMTKNVRPKPGRGALFYNQILHEGELVTKGTKYLIRTDVMAAIQ